MKKALLILFFNCLFFNVFAQKQVPSIKEGTVLTFDAYSKGLGQHITLNLKVNNLAGDPLKLQWSVEGYGTGTFEITSKAIAEGTKLVIKQPDPDGVTTLKDDETIAILSKATFKSLVNNKSFQLNGQNYSVIADTATYKLNDKPADVFHAATENNKNEIWVLNMPDFPLVYHAKSVNRGIEVTLIGVKE